MVRKAVLLFCLFLIAFCGRVLAQEQAPQPELQPGLYRNSVYIEIGGNGGLLSLNYERLLPFAAPGATLALRAGGLFAPYGSPQRSFSFEYYLPIEASVLLGKKAVKLELGFGTTLTGYGGSYLNNFGERTRYNHMDVISLLRVGGRWQQPGKHWFVRVGFTPILQEFYTVIPYPFSPWAGVSVGYNFGK